MSGQFRTLAMFISQTLPAFFRTFSFQPVSISFVGLSFDQFDTGASKIKTKYKAEKCLPLGTFWPSSSFSNYNPLSGLIRKPIQICLSKPNNQSHTSSIRHSAKYTSFLLIVYNCNDLFLCLFRYFGEPSGKQG